MTTPLTPARVEQLKRRAKNLGRDESIPLFEAQQRLAEQHGYTNWSLLQKHSMKEPPALLKSEPLLVAGSAHREYLHGDQHEVHPSTFYCRSCDEFVAPEHFFEKHDKRETLERALGVIDRWNLLPPSRKASRPHNTLNMLEAPAHAFVLDLEHSRGPFYRWLDGRLAEDTEIGDLARDILKDKSFPATATSLEVMRSHLVFRGAGREVIKTFEMAWKKFSSGKVVRETAAKPSATSKSAEPPSEALARPSEVPQGIWEKLSHAEREMSVYIHEKDTPAGNKKYANRRPLHHSVTSTFRDAKPVSRKTSVT